MSVEQLTLLTSHTEKSGDTDDLISERAAYLLPEDGDSRDSGIMSDYKSPVKKIEAPLKNAIRKGLTDRTNTSIRLEKTDHSKSFKMLDEQSPVTRRRPPVRLLSFSVIPSDEEKENSVILPNFEMLYCASSTTMSTSSFSEYCESDIVWTPPKVQPKYGSPPKDELQATKKIIRKRITESILSDGFIQKKRQCAGGSEFFQSTISCDGHVSDPDNTSPNISYSNTSLEDEVFEPSSTLSNISSVIERCASKSSTSRSLTRTVSSSHLDCQECQQRSPLLSPEVKYSLPGVDHPQQESLAFRSISAETLATELRRLGPEEFERRYTLVDCRYPYEYEGGHVKCAVNVHDQDQLETLFFPDDPNHPIRSRIPIFYCEFSQKRGPGMALALRSIDRARNELHYPKVDYAEMYLLDHGYRKFFNDGRYKAECVPCGYVPMTDSAHVSSLIKYKWHKSKSTSQLVVRERERVPLRNACSAYRYRSLVQISSEGEIDEDIPTISPSAKTPDLLPRRLIFVSPECRKNVDEQSPTQI